MKKLSRWINRAKSFKIWESFLKSRELQTVRVRVRVVVQEKLYIVENVY